MYCDFKSEADTIEMSKRKIPRGLTVEYVGDEQGPVVLLL